MASVTPAEVRSRAYDVISVTQSIQMQRKLCDVTLSRANTSQMKLLQVTYMYLKLHYKRLWTSKFCVPLAPPMVRGKSDLGNP